MSRTWFYLKEEQHNLFKQKAQSLNMTEYELTQFLVRLFLNTPENSQPNQCINCQYYQIATSTVIQAFMKLNEALTLVTPEYKRKKA